jgi:signal recognition particle receptor subunit beta
MATLNPHAREVVLKLVYYGPGLCGKTTTLEHLHRTAKPEAKGRLVSLATPVDRTLYFDFLPLRVPSIRGLQVRLQLFTVPGQVHFNATRKLVLTGSDGVVFVSDSQLARADANLESLENLRENLETEGTPALPLVFQHNKRDLPDVLPLTELEAMLNPEGAPSVGSVARTGEGVYQALEKIVDRVLDDLARKLPSTGGAALPSIAREEGGLAAALRRVSSLPPRGSAPSLAVDLPIDRAPPIFDEPTLDRSPPPPSPAPREVPRGAAEHEPVSSDELLSSEGPVSSDELDELGLELEGLDEEPRGRATTGSAATAEPAPDAQPSRALPSGDASSRAAPPSPTALTPPALARRTPPLAELFEPGPLRALYVEACELYAEGKLALAVLRLDTLLTATLAAEARTLSRDERAAQGDELSLGATALMLGAHGPSYRRARRLARRAREAGEVSPREVLAAMAFVATVEALRGGG